MKKKITIITILILIIAIIVIISLMLKQNSKVIYSNSYYINGFIPYTKIIEIYDNGVIKKKEENHIEHGEITKKIAKKELKKIKQAIKKIEKCQLSKVDLKGIGPLLADVDIYINLNKKIIIMEQKEDNKYTYDNTEIEELNKLVSNIINKYLEEE